MSFRDLVQTLYTKDPDEFKDRCLWLVDNLLRWYVGRVTSLQMSSVAFFRPTARAGPRTGSTLPLRALSLRIISCFPAQGLLSTR